MKKQSPYLESWLLSIVILVFFNTEVLASKEVNIEKLLSHMEIADNYSKRKKGLSYVLNNYQQSPYGIKAFLYLLLLKLVLRY